MKKLILIPLFLFFTTSIIAQHQLKSNGLRLNKYIIRDNDTNVNGNKLPVTRKFKCTNLFISSGHSLISTLKINGEREDDAFDSNHNFHPWADKRIDVSLWKSFNRYIWGAIDYSIASNQLYLTYSRAYTYETYFYKLKTTSLINSVGGKIGLGYSFSSSDSKTAVNKYMFCALWYVGIRSNIISSSIEDNGTVIVSTFSGSYMAQDTILPSRTTLMGNNNFTTGFIVQYSFSDVSFNGAIERNKTMLPLGVLIPDKVEIMNIYVKLGIGLSL